MEAYKILIIGYVWPEITSSAAGLRDWNLVDTFQQAGWKVIYASPSQPNAFSEKLKTKGVDTVPVQANDPHFDEQLKSMAPDFVIFDRFVIEEQFGWRVTEVCPEAVRILDTQDLHFLRRKREEALKEGHSIEDIAKCRFDLQTDSTLRELASIYRCDGTMVLSDFELQLLIEKMKIPPELLKLSRFHYSRPEISPGFKDRAGFVLLGNFRHAPNADGVLWFRNELWPLIRKELPSAKVSIYGAYPPREMMNLTHSESGFFVKGPIPDQFPVLRNARVNLAPLRFGAGIKGKITDGWWAGTPVVTTPIGAEGMSENLPWGGRVASNPHEFAALAIQLHEDEALWTECQAHAHALINQLYSCERNSSQLIDYLVQLKKRFKNSRKDNWVGSILRHHSHQSTKYFSKWIEAKNSKKG